MKIDAVRRVGALSCDYVAAGRRLTASPRASSATTSATIARMSGKGESLPSAGAAAARASVAVAVAAGVGLVSGADSAASPPAFSRGAFLAIVVMAAGFSESGPPIQRAILLSS
jgi:hypothetical protein